jgi:gamma-glutamylcysteine synthetase
VPKHALKLPFRNGTVRDLAEQALKIAAHGLQRRARLNASGADERVFVEPLLEIVQANQTPADRKLELFHGPWNGSVRDLAEQALKIAAHGLKRRARLNANGADERIFLEPLLEIVQANQTPAERKLELFHGPWNGSVDPVFREFAY